MEGGGGAQALPYLVNGDRVNIAEFELGALPNTPPTEFSLVLAKDEQPVWVAKGKGALENRKNRSHIKASAMINPAATATRTYTLELESRDNFLMAGTLAGDGEEWKIETFPEDFQGEGVALGVDGGYMYDAAGKVIAAFEWPNVPQKVWLREGLDAKKRELFLTAMSVMWMRKLDLDMTGRQKPRTPPLGQPRDLSKQVQEGG